MSCVTSGRAQTADTTGEFGFCAHGYGAPSDMPARRSRAFGRLERAVDPAQLDTDAASASNQPVTCSRTICEFHAQALKKHGTLSLGCELVGCGGESVT